MQYTLRIKDAKTQNHIETNLDFMEVEVEILTTETVRGREKEKVVEMRKFAYPIGTSEEDVQSDLGKFLETYQADADAAVLDAEKQIARQATDETITSLKGKTIAHGNSRKK